MRIDKQLKAAIKRSGMSSYRLGKLSGVTPQQIRRFVGGERDLQLVNAGKLALALGLEFSPIK